MVSEATRRQIRRTLIRLAQKHQKPGSGSTLGFLRERTARMEWPDLSSVLGDIPWAVVGAVATRAYMPERVTADLDIAVRVQDAAEVRRRLDAAGYVRAGESAMGGGGWRASDGQHVDVLEVGGPWLTDAVIQGALSRDPAGFPVLPLPALVLMKFRAGRTVDIGDVTRMLGQASDSDLSVVRALFAQEAPEDIEDLDSLIRLGRLEMEAP